VSAPRGHQSDASAPAPRGGQPAVPALPSSGDRRPPQPVALLYEPGHRIVHANAAFIAEFGVIPIGVPASEALIDVPAVVFEIVDRVIVSGRPLAAWVEVRGARRRLTVAPRADPETAEVYGVALGLASP
jgi:hypothetical protein